MDQVWLERRRATAACVTAFFDQYLSKSARIPPTQSYALCRLTWVTSAPRGVQPDNTGSVLERALKMFLGESFEAPTFEELQLSLTLSRVPKRVRFALRTRIGFTNFYNAYRNVALTWIRHHSREVSYVLASARRLKSDSDARSLYASIQVLPSISSGRGGIPPESLLTPVVACLDPRARSPIINGRPEVQRALHSLEIADAQLVDRFDGLLGLMNQGGLADALELDAAVDDLPAMLARLEKRTSSEAGRQKGNSRPLGQKDDRDVRVLLRARSSSYTRLHNLMTNRLLPLLSRLHLNGSEGVEMDCMYDVLVEDYDGKGRDLLIEVKASTEMPFCRMAVGQLLDYRRQLLGRTRTDLGALFPFEPSRNACDFLRSVGVRVLWYDGSMKRLRGDIPAYMSSLAI